MSLCRIAPIYGSLYSSSKLTGVIPVPLHYPALLNKYCLLSVTNSWSVLFAEHRRRLSLSEQRGRGRRDGRKRGRGRRRGRVRGAHGERGGAVPRRSAAVGGGLCAAALPLPAAAAAAVRRGSEPLHSASGESSTIHLAD